MSFLTNNPLTRYLRGSKQELEKVTWPTRNEVIFYSIAVIVITVLAAVYFGLLDFILNLGVQSLIGV
jgi:preprotein translocase subunit SecE